jgi:hypothetical protein
MYNGALKSDCVVERDAGLAAAQVVLIRGLAAVGHTVKMLACK